LKRKFEVDAGPYVACCLKLGLHVNLDTRGNEAATAGAPFARLHCTQEKRVIHG